MGTVKGKSVSSFGSSSDGTGSGGGLGPCTAVYYYFYQLDSEGYKIFEEWTFLYYEGNCSGQDTSNPGTGTNTNYTGTGPGGSGGGGYGGNTPPANNTMVSKTIITTNDRPCVTDIVNTIKINESIYLDINNLFDKTTVSTMVNTIANSTNYNVTLTEAVIPNTIDNLGNVSMYNATTITKNGAITTTLNTNYLNAATDLSVARTILHELVHTYFTYGISYNSTDPNFIDFEKENALLFTQGVPKNDQNDAQHKQMAETYVNGLTVLLVKFANSRGITSPTADQSLESYCNDLAWGGLQGTPAYQLFMPGFKYRIDNNIQNENTNATGSTKVKGC